MSDTLPKLHHPRIAIRECRHGRVAFFADDDVIGRALDLYGEWAHFEISFLESFIEGLTGVVIDVGANIGTHALALGRREGVLVHSFEANPLSFSLLVHNLLANDIENVVARNVALSSETRLLEVRETSPVGHRNWGGFTIDELESRGAKERAPMHLVPMATLDTFDLRDVLLIKIDSEGMEYQVLLGALKTIRSNRPVLYFEQRSEANLSEILSLLRSVGYRAFWHPTYPFNRNNFRGHNQNVFWEQELNIVAFPDARDADGLFEVLDGPFDPPRIEDVRNGWDGKSP